MPPYPMETKAGGYIIVATEDQDRGLAHIHIAYQPAKEPPTKHAWKSDARAEEAMPWVDELVCARRPDIEVLRDFSMVMKKADAIKLLGVTDENGEILVH